MNQTNLTRCAALLLVGALLACGSQTPSSGGAAGSGASSGGAAGSGACVDERRALVQKIQASTTCQTAQDCVSFATPALQAESGNCAGVFYVSRAEEAAIKMLEAARAACQGGDRGSCAFGPLPPACVGGVCQASSGGGGSSQTSICVGERQALVQKIQASTTCQTAEDCASFTAPALQAESGNCAGIFYVSRAEKAALDALEAARAACEGGAGGSCALGPSPPACTGGVCRASAP